MVTLFNLKIRIEPLFLIFLLISTGFFSTNLFAENKQIKNNLESKQIPAIKWLLQQIVPNKTIPIPAPNRRKLIVSYRVPPGHPDFPYLSGRSFTYDNALAVIAFTMTGHYRQAESILSALNRLSTRDGALWFAYNTHNSWPSAKDHEGAIQRTGATAWVGYSIVYYLQKRMEEHENFLLQDPLAKQFLQFAEKTANFLARKQVLDKNDLRHGLITGGSGTYQLKLSKDSKGVKEDFISNSIDWVSAEHNIDAYFFLRDLARITKNSVYKKSSALIRTGLLRIWDVKSGQFFQGIKKSQRIDRFLPLDTASWGAFFLMSIGEHRKANLSLAATDRFYSAATESIKGYAPYYKDPVYENPSINSHFYPREPGMTWNKLRFIWGEGSLGVAAAFAKSGDRSKAQRIIEDIMDLQVAGGIRYSLQGIPFRFSTFPSVASTAWLVISTQLLMNPNDLFWGE